MNKINIAGKSRVNMYHVAQSSGRTDPAFKIWQGDSTWNTFDKSHVVMYSCKWDDEVCIMQMDMVCKKIVNSYVHRSCFDLLPSSSTTSWPVLTPMIIMSAVVQSLGYDTILLSLKRCWMCCLGLFHLRLRFWLTNDRYGYRRLLNEIVGYGSYQQTAICYISSYDS